MDVRDRDGLAFPGSLPEFQRLFPDDAACAAYLEKSRWDEGFVCPHCQMGGDPFQTRSALITGLASCAAGNVARTPD